MLKKKMRINVYMDNLNLDIGAYSTKDLLELFSLNDTYTLSQLTESKKKLVNQLYNLSNGKTEKKREILFFIDSAYNLLDNHFQKKISISSNLLPYKRNSIIVSDDHVIIEDPNVEAGKYATAVNGRTIQNDLSNPGYINPINIKSLARGLNIDTRFRENYNITKSSDVTLHLMENFKKVVSMRIASVEIPTTIYAISKSLENNTLIIKSNIVVSSKDKTLYRLDNNMMSKNEVTIDEKNELVKAWRVTLPDGNYEMDWQGASSAFSIEVAMNNAIALSKQGYIDNTADDGFFYVEDDSSQEEKINPSKDLCFRVDRISGKSFFGVPSNNDNDDKDDMQSTGSSTTTTDDEKSLFKDGFKIIFTVSRSGNLELNKNIQLKLGWQLGFRAGNYSILGGAGTISSEGICFITGPRYIFVSIDDGQKSQGSSLIAAFSESIMDKNIITRINWASVVDDAGVYKSASDIGLSNQLNRTRYYFGPVDIDRLKIQLLDEYGRVIDLNYMDWSMSLIFETLYD